MPNLCDKLMLKHHCQVYEQMRKARTLVGKKKQNKLKKMRKDVHGDQQYKSVNHRVVLYFSYRSSVTYLGGSDQAGDIHGQSAKCRWVQR